MVLSVAACGGFSSPAPTPSPTAITYVPTATCAEAFDQAVSPGLHTSYDLDWAISVCTLADWRTHFEAHADRLDARFFSGTADSVLTYRCHWEHNARTPLCQALRQQ